MRRTLFTTLAIAVALGLGLAGTARAQTAVSGSFGIDALSNPITGWQLTNLPGGTVTNIVGSITTGLPAAIATTAGALTYHGHGVAAITFNSGASSNQAEMQISPGGVESTTGWYSYTNQVTGSGISTPWIQVSWIDNNTSGTQVSPKIDWFATDTTSTSPLTSGAHTSSPRVTGGTEFGVGYYTAQRWNTAPGEAGTTEEAEYADGSILKSASGSYQERTVKIAKNANGTYNILEDGGAAYGNYEMDNVPFFSSTGTDPSEGSPNAQMGTMWGLWNELEIRVRSAEVGETFYWTDLVMGSLPFVKGDMNGDGLANNFDIAPFELALTDPGSKSVVGSYVNEYPAVTDYITRGDTNYDYVLNNFDISGFEAGLTGGFGPSAPVPEPSTLVLLALGGVGLLLSRVRKNLSAKWLKVAAVLLVVSLAISVGTAQASTMFLSTTSTSPALINPTVTTTVGGSVTLYVFWEPTTELVPDQTDYPGATETEQLSGWGHNIVDDNAILSRTTYTYLNPTTGGSPRWGSTNAGSSSGTYLVQTANAVKVGGSNLGFTATNAQGYSNVGPNGVWRLSTLTFTATGPGTSNIYLEVGTAGISFENSPTERNINFGFNDAAVASNSFNGASTLPDATITVVPEPGTLALLGLGAVGLAAVARRRRRAG